MFTNLHIEYRGMGYFTSDDLWIHPERIETTHEIIYVTKGTVYIEDCGLMHTLEKGSIIILPAKKMHRGFRESRGVAFYWLHFNMYFDEPKFPYTLSNFSSPHIFRELLHYANLPESDSFVTNSITAYILAQIVLCGKENENKNSKLASEIAEWIRINADAQLTVIDTAKHFGYNPEHISRIFRKNYNMGIKEYIQNLIVRKAKDYLANTNYSVKEIAALLNFADANLFTNFFKYHENTVPLKYRNSYSQTHMNNS